MIFKKSEEGSKEGFPPRKMYQGDWKCSECGAAITELPFEPSGDRRFTVENVTLNEDLKDSNANLE